MNKITGEFYDTPCSDSPLFFKTYFDFSEEISIGSFSDENFSGYIGSGLIYLRKICFGSRCTFMNVNVVTEI